MGVIMDRLSKIMSGLDSAFYKCSILFSLFVIAVFLWLIIFSSVKAGEGFHLFGTENILFTINFGEAVDGVPSKFSF